VSRDLVAEDARGLSGTILDVLANCGHGEGMDRGARYRASKVFDAEFIKVKYVQGRVPKCT
jgi:hypothetical protein